MSGNSPLCPTGHRPFGAAAQKVWTQNVSDGGEGGGGGGGGGGRRGVGGGGGFG